MPRDVDVKRLRLFRQVAECGGLTAAEAALNVNLSTISAHLCALESQLGLRLCERGRGGFSLTEDGRAVLAAGDRLLESFERFDAELAALRQTLSGHLRVGIVDCTTSDRQALLDQRLDLVIGPFSMATAGVEQHDLYTERLSLYAGGGHPVFAHPQRDIDVQELNGQGHVARGYLQESQVLGRMVSFNTCATATASKGWRSSCCRVRSCSTP